MGIKPALGWLALLLFTTSASAEGSRDLTKQAPKSKTPGLVAPAPRSVIAVAPKTKAPPIVQVSTPAHAPLAVVESTTKPKTDYEADVYSGVPLDTPFAKERGLDKGLVTMVFERQRRAAFRVGRDRVRRVVRLASDDRGLAIVRASTAPVSAAARPKDHLDVLDTEDGFVVVDTASAAGGMVTTSEIYAFPRTAVTLEQRVAVLEVVPSPAKERVREALVIAEWSH
jgi:hypothetical protein